jgi:hypothetical protein
MATTFKWTTFTDRSGSTGGSTSVASTSSGSYVTSALYDNTTNLDEWAVVEIVLASLTPTAGAYLQIFLTQSPDGTNTEDPPSSTNPAYHTLVATVALTTGAAAKRVSTPAFRIPGCKFKLTFLNKAGVSTAAGTNTMNLWTFNEQGV